MTWETNLYRKRYNSIMSTWSNVEMFLILPLLVPAYLAGEITLGTMQVLRNSIEHLQMAFQIAISSYGEITQWRAAVTRLQIFESAAEAAKEEEEGRAPREKHPFSRHYIHEKLKGQSTGRYVEKPVVIVQFVGEAGGEVVSPDAAAAGAALLSGGASSSTAAAPRRAPSQTDGDPIVSIRNVDIYLPDCRLVLTFDDNPLTFSVGDKVLLSGPVGSGKSTLIRTLCGIWPFLLYSPRAPQTEDCYIKIALLREECMFCPRNPWLPPLSVRDLLHFPRIVRDRALDEECIAVLKLVGLEHIALPEQSTRPRAGRGAGAQDQNHHDVAGGVAEENAGALAGGSGEAGTPADEGQEAELAGAPAPAGEHTQFDLNRAQNWDATLSGGEKNRITIAQALLFKPKLLCLDEAVANMAADVGLELYKKVVEMCEKQKSVLISISHDVGTLLPLHNLHLEVDPRTKTLKKRAA